MKTIVATWTYEGLLCEVAEVSPSHMVPWYCGYVTLPETHPDTGKDYDQLPIEVHGGLTFGDGGKFGFDCAHGTEGPEWRDMERVKLEVELMAEQFLARGVR